MRVGLELTKSDIIRLSRSKTEYIKCDFGVTMQEEGDIRLDGLVIHKKTLFTT
jgi:hypothetical protein